MSNLNIETFTKEDTQIVNKRMKRCQHYPPTGKCKLTLIHFLGFSHHRSVLLVLALLFLKL